MGHPLAVARPRRAAHRPAVNIAELAGEAAVPDPPALGMLDGEVLDVLDVGAEAGGAGQRAVGAGETPFGDLVPERMLRLGLQDRGDACRHGSRLRIGGRLGRGRQEEAQATRKEIPTQPSEKSIAAGRELLEAHRNGAAEGFISAAAYRTGVRAAIIRAMVEKLDGESLAVLLKGMAVEDLEAMQLFVRLLPQVGRDFAKYKSLQAMYRKLNGERCKLAMLALSGTRLTPEHTNEPKAPSARLMEVAAQRRASLHQHADPKPLTGERSPPRSFNRLARS